MTPDARLLKAKRISPLLERALPLAPNGTGLAVVSGDDVLAKAPSGNGFDPLCGDFDGLSRPILAEGREVGSLLVRCPDSDRGEALAELLEHALSATTQLEGGLRSVATETLERYRELETLHRAVYNLGDSLRLGDVTRSLTEECGGSDVPAEMGLVIFRESEQGRRQVLDAFGEAMAVGLDRILRGRLFREAVAKPSGEIINQLESDPRWNNEVEGIRSLLILPLISPNLSGGALVLASRSPNAFTAAHRKRMGTIASVAATAMGNAYYFEETRVLMDALLRALAAAIDARDAMTSGHSQRVATLSVSLAKLVNGDRDRFPGVRFGEANLQEIYYAGLLHDVGKIGVREEVLNKATRIPPALLDVIFLRLDMRERESGEPAAPAKERLSAINVKPFLEREDVVLLHSLRESRFGPAASPLLTGEEAAAMLVPSGNLSRDERKEIERHPGESFRILRHIPFTREFSNLLEIIHQHHERLDGSGYPRGLSGEEILLQARLLAVVDTFDAVTQKRHYKPALPRAKALDVLREEAEDGRMDAGLVDLFVERVDEIMENVERLEQANGREPISQPAYRA